jgi:hypothetical protein
MPDRSPRQRAENAAQNVCAHFFGVALAESDLLAERCEPRGLHLAGVILQDCVLEPVFLGRIALQAACQKIFSTEAAGVFQVAADKVFMNLFCDAFLEREGVLAPIPPLFETFYRETAAVRMRQYQLAERHFGLRLYRLVKGSDWLDALFLRNVLRRNFADRSLNVPDEPLDAFAHAIVKDIRHHAGQIRDDGYSFVRD